MSRIHLCAWKQSSECSLYKEPHDWGSWRVYQVSQPTPHLMFEHQSQRPSLDLFHTWVLGMMEQNNAWSPKRERRSGTPRAMQEGAGIPGQAGLQHTTKDQTSSRFLEAARVGKRPLHAWNQLFWWFPGVCSKGSRWIKKSQAKKLTHLFIIIIYYRYFAQLCVKPPAPHNHKHWSRRVIFLPPT